MNKLSLLLIAFLIVIGFSSCQKIMGKGPVITEERSIGSFSVLASSVPVVVTFRQAPAYKVTVSAQQNILNVLETYTSGSELIIKLRNNTILGRHEPVTVEVNAPEINGFKLSGSGSIVAEEPIMTDDMAVIVSGSGTVKLQQITSNTFNGKVKGSGHILIPGKITTDELALAINGSGDIRVNHAAGRLLSGDIGGSGSITVAGDEFDKSELSINGSGDIQTSDLPAKIVSAFTSGSGTMRVNVLQKLHVKISGSGHVYYKGQPETDIQISGSGKVIRQ